MSAASAAAIALTLSLTVFADDGAWPQWRGPRYDGVAQGSAPIHWSAADSVAWKGPVPGKGHSSPVLWGDRIFLTTAIPVEDAANTPSAEQSVPSAGARR